MNRFFLVLSVLVAFILPVSNIHAEITGLKAELDGSTRSRSSFPDSDEISFSVKVTNTSLKTINGGYITARIPKSVEYSASGGVFAGRTIDSLDPNQSTIVEVGGYLIPRSKKISGKIEFAFDNDFISSGNDFKKLKVFSFKLNSEPLSSSADDSRSNLIVKYLSKDTLKQYSKNTKGAKLLSLTFKSSANISLLNPGFTYLSQQTNLNLNELSNLTLWSDGVQVCDPVQLTPGYGYYYSLENGIAFNGCSINLEKNKIKVVSLKADISKDIPNDAIRKFSFGGYSIPQTVDLYNKDVFSKQFKLK